MANLGDKRKRHLVGNSSLDVDQELTQQARQRLFRQRKRKLLEKVRLRLAAKQSDPAEEPSFRYCPNCGEDLKEWGLAL